MVAIAAMALESLSLVEELDFKVSDQFLRIKGRQIPPSGVVVVAIDEPSYKELNVSFDKPWPRALHAQMLARLKELGVKRVAFDVLFTGPSSDPAADQKLADALTSVPTVIGVQSSVRYVSNQGGGTSLRTSIAHMSLFVKLPGRPSLACKTKAGSFETSRATGQTKKKTTRLSLKPQRVCKQTLPLRSLQVGT